MDDLVLNQEVNRFRRSRVDLSKYGEVSYYEGHKHVAPNTQLHGYSGPALVQNVLTPQIINSRIESQYKSRNPINQNINYLDVERDKIHGNVINTYMANTARRARDLDPLNRDIHRNERVDEVRAGVATKLTLMDAQRKKLESGKDYWNRMTTGDVYQAPTKVNGMKSVRKIQSERTKVRNQKRHNTGYANHRNQIRRGTIDAKILTQVKDNPDRSRAAIRRGMSQRMDPNVRMSLADAKVQRINTGRRMGNNHSLAHRAQQMNTTLPADTLNKRVVWRTAPGKSRRAYVISDVVNGNLKTRVNQPHPQRLRTPSGRFTSKVIAQADRGVSHLRKPVHYRGAMQPKSHKSKINLC